MLAAEHRRKEPRKIPRPFEDKPQPPPKPGLVVETDGRVRAVGAAAFIQHAAAKGQVGPRV